MTTIQTTTGREARKESDMDSIAIKPTLIEATDSYDLWSWKDCHHHLLHLSNEMAEAMTTCTASTDIAFSYTSGTGIDGYRVSCFRVIDEPKIDTDWREVLPGHGAVLKTRSEVRRFGLAMGYIVEFRSKRRSR